MKLSLFILEHVLILMVMLFFSLSPFYPVNVI